jgi:translation initiation factor 2B subunit (eIF-2B alpha/beta/delta family)
MTEDGAKSRFSKLPLNDTGREDLSPAFNRILNDRRSGSAQLVKNLLELIIYDTHTSSQIDLMCEMMLRSYPQMALVQNTLGRLLRSEKNKVVVANQLLTVIENASKKIAANSAKVIPPSGRIMTISQSQTVLSIFERASLDRNILEVFIPYCQPASEGEDMARKLSRMGHSVTVFPDLSTGRMVPVCDMIIVGADQYCDEYFVNRAGTLGLALMARIHSKPFYVATSTMKKMSVCVLPDEAQPRFIDGIKYISPMFERIPSDLVTSFIQDE